MTKLLKAAPIREKAILSLKEKTENLINKGIIPTMKVILVGNNPASVIYTNNKKKFIEKFGGSCEIIGLDSALTEKEFLEEVSKIVNNDKVHGCFIQLPLPDQLSHIDVGTLIPGEKDVDGFNEENITKLFKGSKGEDSLLPCTPKGIVTLLKSSNIELEGKKCTIIGRSEIVGKPMALMLLNENATVTVCHSKTKDLKWHTQNADIIISAIGRPKFLDSSFLSPDKNQVIVDVGMNHDENNKLCGDVNFEDVHDKVAAITPVPGGVGPMTILSLAENLIQAAEKKL